MKATINGVVVEGSPQEIAEFMKLHGSEPKKLAEPYQPGKPWTMQPIWQIHKDGTIYSSN